MNRTGLATLLGVSLLVAVIAGLLQLLAPHSFTASATLMQSEPQPGFSTYGVVQSPPISGSVYRTFITDGPALTQALLERGEATDPAHLQRTAAGLSVAAGNGQLSGIIRISHTGRDPARSADLVNRLARATVAWDADRGRDSLHAGLTDPEAAVARLEALHAQESASGADSTATAQQLEQARADLAAARARLQDVSVAPLVSVLRFAAPPTEADRPQPLRAALLGFAVTALAGTGLLLLGARPGRGLSSKQAGSLTQLPILSTFPGGLNVRSRARAERDAADILRGNLLRSGGPDNGRALVILVTTAIGAGGRRVVSTSLADSFSRAGYRTLLLDTNLRSHTMRQLFEITQEEGRQYERQAARGTGSSTVDRRTLFDVVPAFSISDSPADLLRTRLPELIGRWRDRFDVIVLDSAPVLPYPDTRGIAHLADRSLLVVSVSGSDPEGIARASRELRRLNANPVGLVALRRAGGYTRLRYRLRHAFQGARSAVTRLFGS